MDDEIKAKERILEKLKVEDEIEAKRMSIAQKKAVEKEMKQQFGGGWRKILGFSKGLRPDNEALHDLYAVNPDLRDLSKPSGLRRL